MSKKGSALMQVLVIGLIIAAFAVLMLRYAVTRSSNLARTDRILKSQITADSCLDQYMSYRATAELYGQPYISTNTLNCSAYDISGTTTTITMTPTPKTDVDGSAMTVVTFSVPVFSGQ
ncbi:MAG: hypothetical protein II726_02325 [Elusimicrobiaceae bacterium]|nr:hypothetical protein [Elusimicrobiaceae bacterium]